MVTIDIDANGAKFSFVIHDGDVQINKADARAACPDPNYEDIISRFIDHIRRDGKSRATAAAYYYSLNAFTAWLAINGLSLDLVAITSRYIADWKTYQQTIERTKPTTINLRLSAVSQLFEWAITEGMCQSNPVMAVKSLSKDRLRPKALSDNEVQALLGATAYLRNRAILELMTSSGLRVSEVLALRRDDIELIDNGGIVTIRHAKGGKYRQVPIPKSACKAILFYLSTVSLKPTDPVWQGPRGAVTTSSAIRKMLNILSGKAGLKRVKPHDLRHTFAARYLAANPGDIRGLAALMGHASLNTTMIYTEPTQADLAERVQRAANSK